MKINAIIGLNSKISIVFLGILLSSIFLHFFGDSLDNFSYDYSFILRGHKESKNEVIIVAIDETSFDEINIQWPWPRSIHAKLLNSLVTAGVKTVGFDLLFAEPSEEDEAFANALSAFPHTVLVNDISSINDAEHNISGELITEPSSLMDLMTAPLQRGFANMQADSDGYIRSLEIKRENIFSFSYMLAKDFLSQKGETLIVDDIDERRYIDFIGPPKSIQTISYYQALEPDKYLPKDYLKDKIILVGFATASQATSSMSVIDHYLAPYSRHNVGYYPGVEIHAHATEGLLSNSKIDKENISEVWLLGILLGIVWGIVIAYSHLMIATLASLILLGLILYLNYYLFSIHNWDISPVYLFTPTITIIFLNPFIKYLNSLKQRKFLKDAFSTYLAPQVVKQIISNPRSFTLGGKELQATILFLDIVGYTAISEKVTANELISFVNRTLGRLSEIILKNGGMIDKFIGDCIMAGWGLPLESTDHARLACNATLEILKEMPQIAAEEKERSGADLSIRIGLSTGQVIAGNVGGGKRFNYTALGNDVNLASRLESLNKYYGTMTLVSEKTKQMAGSDFYFRKIDKIRVKGQNIPVSIYELCHEPLNEIKSEYEKALELYFQNNFINAKNIFIKLAESGDKPSSILLKRCEDYIITPPDTNWDGVHSMTEK